MKDVIEVLRVLLSLFFLAVSSWYDFKTREVPNRVWVLFGPLGFALSLMQYYHNQFIEGGSFLLFWMLSFAVTSGISLVLFYLGFFGGADAKALICLSIALPVYPSSARHHADMLTPLFPLAVLGNAVIISSLLVLVIASYNIFNLTENGGKMFEGLEKEPLWAKIVAFVTGFRVDLDKIRKGSHYIPLEYFSKGKDGEIIRHLRISPRLEEETLQSNLPDNISKELEGKIWATPGLPFLIFVTAGFLSALLVGDFVTWLVVRLTAG